MGGKLFMQNLGSQANTHHFYKVGVNFMKIMLNKSCIFNIFAVNTEYFMHITDLI